MKINKVYTAEFKAQCVKEVQDTGSVSVVSRTHQVPLATLHRWVVKPSSRQDSPTRKHPSKEESILRKKLADVELENKVLKELLKKTNQAWLKD